jgi:hypothetical protein
MLLDTSGFLCSYHASERQHVKGSARSGWLGVSRYDNMRATFSEGQWRQGALEMRCVTPRRDGFCSCRTPFAR